MQKPEGTSAGRATPPQIPDHELLRVIGAGSYGEVWLARNLFGRHRAIKIVRRAAFEDSKPFDREFNGLKEFEPISRSHPAFVNILQVGRDPSDSYFYCVMELADDQTNGSELVVERYRPRTLHSEIAVRSSLPVGECVRIVATLAEGLAVLHGHGLIHRDIKPSNIVFVNGTPKLADIGLVHTIANAQTMVGTQGYIPPEGPGTVQADIYSLGKVLYEASTGHDRQQYPELPDFIRDAPNPQEFTELNEVLVRACHPDPKVRYATAEELRSDLEVLNSGKSLRRLRTLERRWEVATRLSITTAVLALVLGTAGWFLYRQYDRARQARSSQVITSVAYGARLMDEGNSFAALAWFVDALRLRGELSDEAQADRIRINAALLHSPRLARCLWHTSKVHCAQFSPDSQHIIFGDSDGLVTVLRAADGQAVLSVRHQNGSAAETVRFSPDGKRFVSTSKDRRTQVWAFPEGRPLARLEHSNSVRGAFFTRDGSRVLTTGGSGDLLLWDLATERVVSRFAGHKGTVWGAAFSPDEKRLVSAGSDGQAIVWNTETRRPELFIPHASWLYDAAFSPDGRWIATAGYDRNLRVWDATTGYAVLPPMKHDAPVNSVRFSPDGRFATTASFDSSIRLWNLASGELASSVMRHSANVEHSSFSPDGRFLLTAGWDGTIRVWEPDAWIAPPEEAKFSPDGTTRFETRGSVVEVFKTGASNRLARLEIPYRVRSLHISEPGGRFLALPSETRTEFIQSYDVGAQKEVRVQTGSNSGRKLWTLAARAAVAASVSNATVETWDLNSGQPLCRFDGPAPASGLSLSPDGRILALSQQNDLYLFDVRTGDKLAGPLGHALPISCLAFDSEGHRIVTGCADGNLTEGYACVWDARTGAAVSARLYHRDGVIAACFSPDGTMVATGGEDFHARVWNIKGGPPLPPFQHQFQVASVRFTRDGKWLVTGSRDETARVWDVQTGLPITPAIAHPTHVLHAAYLGEQHLLVTEDAFGRARTWDMLPATNTLAELSLLSGFFAGEAVVRNASDRTNLLRMLDRIAAARTTPPAQWHLRAAQACEMAGLFLGAEFHLQRLRQWNGSSDELASRLAAAQAEAGHFHEARATYLSLGSRLSPEQAGQLAFLDAALEGTNCFQFLNPPSPDTAAPLPTDYLWLGLLVHPAAGSEEHLRRMLAAPPGPGSNATTTLLRAAAEAVISRAGKTLDPLPGTLATATGEATPESLGLRALITARAGRFSESRNLLAEAVASARFNPGTWMQRLRFELLQKKVESALRTASPTKEQAAAR